VKKVGNVPPKQEEDDNITRHTMPASISNKDESTKGQSAKGFNFIKAKTPITNPPESTNTVSSANVSVKENSTTENIDYFSGFGNIDQFLTENANILGNNTSSNNTGTVDDIAVSNEISSRKLTDDNKSVNKVETNTTTAKPTAAKVGFNFIKKQKDVQDGDTKSSYKAEEKEIVNENTEVKSFKSLRLGHADNTSVSMDDESKHASSVKQEPIEHRKESTADLFKLKDSKISSKSTTNIPSLNNPEKIKAKLESDILKNEELFENLIVKMHSLKVKLSQKETEKAELISEKTDYTHREEEAIANNDFEEAEAIENYISELNSKIDKITSDIENFNKDMVSLRDNELLIIRSRMKVIDESMAAFGKLKTSQEYEFETFQNNDINKHKNDNIRIKKLKEKLEILQSSLENDKAVNIF
jgi:hypothetical protein